MLVFTDGNTDTDIGNIISNGVQHRDCIRVLEFPVVSHMAGPFEPIVILRIYFHAFSRTDFIVRCKKRRY